MFGRQEAQLVQPRGALSPEGLGTAHFSAFSMNTHALTLFLTLDQGCFPTKGDLLKPRGSKQLESFTYPFALHVGHAPEITSST